MNYKILTLFVFTLIITSCNDDENYLVGYNENELFATPTQQELSAVLADWSSRDLSTRSYNLENSVNVSANMTLKIISYDVSGAKEYAMLLVPKVDVKIPVRMYIGGFGYDVTTNSLILTADESLSANPFVFAVPALRGQSLDVLINGTHYTTPLSGGDHCDAFDGAADDAIALLNVIQSTEPNADVDRVAVRGGSRGATVALLAGIRDPRVKMSIGVAGPTDLVALTSVSTNDLTYQCQFLGDLVGKKITIADARLKMISSSPIFFADRLPRTQLHLGADDKIVPVEQGEELKEKVTAVGGVNLFELFIYEGRGHENIADGNVEMNERIEGVLGEL